MDVSPALLQFEQLVERLRTHVPDARPAAQIEAARTIYLLTPSTFLGHAFVDTITQRLLAMKKRVVWVDDTLSTGPNESEVKGVKAFRGERPEAGLAINLANAPFVHGLFERAAAVAGISCVDIIPVLNVLSLPVIYETAGLMRDRTLARLDATWHWPVRWPTHSMCRHSQRS